MREFLEAKIEHFRRKHRHPGGAPPRGIGVIGLHEGRTLLHALNRTTRARAVAGCDLNADKLAALRQELPDLFLTPRYEEMLARPDVSIVAIYTPDAMHAEHIVQAFEAGKDVICTKPLVNSLADARRILEAGRRTGRKLLVGQSTRFFEPFRRQRRDIEQGICGELELVDAHYIHRMDWFYEKSPWAATDTDWIFLGMSHPVDLVRWYLGRIAEVHAYGVRTALGERFGLRGFDVYIANLRGVNGRIGRAMGHYGLHELPSARNCIELFLCGTKRTSLAQYHDMKYRYTDDEGTEITEDPLYELRHYHFNSEIHGMHYGEFANYTEYFIESLEQGSAYSPGLEEGVETICVMEALRRSATSGTPVRLEGLYAEAGL